ncbi:MAG: hypothetical protein A2086_02275 [Spirochaetes bacterium GWD1_27_9]|nr:MAG: hypothetical protein A2Z98_10095 [Spirochaetes bacterium GWB1_27_13]OHD22143.1 MAG: hypothetical protein A2Y34_14830 [Spirochaetes bacterium GWC1_27_15]OHD29264.1 MAG: hypothetical protein A2086_02275 [Spirochaetes bacterium GWD1_27_9]
MLVIKERLLNEIEKLDENEMFFAYDVISNINIHKNNLSKKRKYNHESIRNILNKTNKNLSDEIIEMREDRI